MAKSSDLPGRWGLPDNSRLTPQQYSFRLPVHVAAKLAALCELYPNRSRTEIVGDLLSEALQRVEQSFPFVAGAPSMKDPVTGKLDGYPDVGPGTEFRKLANKHYLEMEKALGNKKPTPLYSRDCG